jgi:phenylacetate-CoA ligase
MHLRRSLILNILRLQGSSVPKRLSTIKNLVRKSDEEIVSFQQDYLYRLLKFSQKHIPYYSEIIPEEVFDHENGLVHLDVFSKIPVLTKDILHERNEDLRFQDIPHSWKAYENTSGGSTGEPSRFLQDKVYSDWNIANKLFYKEYYGDQIIGDLELRMWGSEKDILKGQETLDMRLRNAVYNRIDLNTYRMTEEKLREYVDIWNQNEPQWVESYVHSIHDFAKYILAHNIEIYRPKGILTSAGKLEDFAKQDIEKAFGAPVYNRYGSREVGDVACSDEKSSELILSPWNHYVEILDENLQPYAPGTMGKLYVTVLHNRSMPLIRYQIEDVGTFSQDTQFGVPKIAQINGRSNSILITNHARLDSTALTTSFYTYSSIKQYQFIQKTKSHFVLRVVVHDQDIWKKDSQALLKRFRKIMGEDITIDFVEEQEILPSKSGKYLYIISEVSE